MKTDIMDRALEILDGAAPEYCGGLCNHGPMAAEAMQALGRSDAVLPWVEYYSRRLQAMTDGLDAVSDENWAAMLGKKNFSGWHDFFEPIVLKYSPWTTPVRTWVPRLAQGISGAAAHGALRTAHAVRSLMRSETRLRLKELASALAYWASEYRPLPGHISSETRGYTPFRAVRRLRPIPGDQQRQYGLLDRRLDALSSFPAFAAVVNLLETSADLDRIMSGLTEAFAGLYLANAGGIPTATVLMHTVTLPFAVRSFLPFLDRRAAESLVRYTWQASAALFTVMGNRCEYGTSRADHLDRHDLINAAIDTADEQAIKFTEACLREYALNPNPVYIQATRDALKRISEISDLK